MVETAVKLKSFGIIFGTDSKGVVRMLLHDDFRNLNVRVEFPNADPVTGEGLVHKCLYTYMIGGCAELVRVYGSTNVKVR